MPAFRDLMEKIANPLAALPVRLPGVAPMMPMGPEERLPGMSQWAPRAMVERMSLGMNEGVPIGELIQHEENRGLGSSVAKGALTGASLGTAGGRLIGGNAPFEPFKEIYRQGLGKGSFDTLRKLPTAMKIAPLAGLGVGGLAGLYSWNKDRKKRKSQATDSIRGLTAERLLNYDKIQSAAGNALKKLPMDSASQANPKVVITSNMGH